MFIRMRTGAASFTMLLSLVRSLIVPALVVAPVTAQNLSDWKRQVGPPLTPDQIDLYLNLADLPTGLYLQDTQQAFTNLGNDLNNQNPWLREANHSGFSLRLYEPKAWLGAKRAVTQKRFRWL